MVIPSWLEHWNARREPFIDECRQARASLLADLENSAAAQDRVLSDLIDLSTNSIHWREQNYDVIAFDKSAFRAILPIMRYDDFAPIVEREIRTKGGVLTCSPVLRWLKTSGTSGTPKRVPYTLHWLLTYRIPAMKAMWSTYIEQHPELLAHPFATLDTQTVREDVYEFVHGVEHQSISNRHPQINSRDWNPPWYEAPWFGPNTPSSHEGRMYHRIRHLIGKDLHYISSINPSLLISLRDHIGGHGTRLVHDLRNGTLEGAPWGKSDEQAAAHLESVLRNPDFSLKDVWPSLTLYSCWLTSSAGLYQSKLDAVFPGVDKLPFMSCGTEGVTTIPIDGTLHSQPLAINQAFFEFVPVTVALGDILENGGTVDTLLFDEVEAGHDYHLIMSQGNGLFRLWTGDIYRVDRVINGVPWIHFVHRDGVFHSFTGEKITEAQVTQAIKQGFQRLDLDMGLYICGPRWGEPPNYVVLVEGDSGENVGNAISACIDHELKTINIEYATKRDSGRLNPIEVIIVPHIAINSYFERRRLISNAAQYKFNPFRQDINFVSEIVSN